MGACVDHWGCVTGLTRRSTCVPLLASAVSPIQGACGGVWGHEGACGGVC